MNLADPTVRQRFWDRWADGELEPSLQRQLLEHCTQNPCLWRELALAFVEHQALTAILHGQEESLRIPAAQTRRCASTDARVNGIPWRVPKRRIHDQPLDEHHPATTAEPAAPNADRAYRRQWRVAGSAIAAMLLLLIGAGAGSLVTLNIVDASSRATRVAGEHGGDKGGREGQAVLDRRSRPDRQTSVPATEANEFLPVMVTDGQSNGLGELNLPVVPSEEALRDASQNAWWPTPQPLVERLEQLGYDVHVRRGFMPVETSDGQRLLVPINSAHVVRTVGWQQ